jgi:TusE/DsrC/DsvC family sulfur relay protein
LSVFKLNILGKGAKSMETVTTRKKKYPVDSNGFLVDFNEWDEDFAKILAPELGIPGGMTKEHWDVIHNISNAFRQTGRCPLIYETCRHCGLRLKELKRLFPAGYLRGACKLAGITYKEGYYKPSYLPETVEDLNVIAFNATYEVDVRGFLVDPHDWDEYFALYRAYDMKIPGGKLTEKHWRIITFLRDYYEKNGGVPTVYETCEANQIDLEALELLFPDGYHRGAVKIAGLRVR